MLSRSVIERMSDKYVMNKKVEESFRSLAVTYNVPQDEKFEAFLECVSEAVKKAYGDGLKDVSAYSEMGM